MKLQRLRKKAAMELSVSTMIVIVIAVVLLILALVFVRRIFTGAIYNVDVLNEKVKNEINKLFEQPGQKIVFYTPGTTVKVKQTETYGVAFGIANLEKREVDFNYNTDATESSCPELISEDAAQQWIGLGRTGTLSNIPSGDFAYGLVKVSVPATAPVGCQIRYNVNVRIDGTSYATSFFDVEIISKSAIGFG